MKITVINPNSSLLMTQTIETSARQAAANPENVSAVCPGKAPASIEGYADGVVAAKCLLSLVEENEKSGTAGYVVACFDDTGVEAVREVAKGPVIGIGEAAMQTASIISSRYSIITSMERSVPIIEENGRRYGLLKKCRGVHAFNLPVLSFEENADGFDYRLIRETAQRVVDSDRSDALILGCGGMSHLRQKLSDDLGICVVEGIAPATRIIEGLVALGLRTSKSGAYDYPLQKSIPSETDVK